MRILSSILLSAVIALGISGPVLADASGVAKGVDPEASALLDNQTRTLVVGGDIFLGDVIKTGPKGLVQILFADNTKLVIGPNSSLIIEDYLVRNDGSAGKLAINMLGGTFRFITGDSPKGAYEIITPSGTIGVRGTAFDAFVDELGIPHVLMFLGTTLLKSYGGDSEVLTGLCQMGEITDEAAEIVGNSSDFTGEDREELKRWFKYALNQSSLLREFWLGHALECTRKPPEDGGPVSILSDQGTGNGCPEGQYPDGEGGCGYPG
ncbi:MAG: FecR domain-containing protein [Devosia sp.]